ncbi:MAG: phosphonate ABC transporter, permease protein PhnE [Spirochaetales bacterium]|uniref:Phosphonate ABC transporter, permease protein PhnE n=1 Tax=Candidatus Thalassospirochaeta sargassi TaxID=3119039 RepID=A0AAJ1ICD6_9SPIO|nr:phosphonate ABC transporter, permease protein PhnE [Spirochaetales bacterium]
MSNTNTKKIKPLVPPVAAAVLSAIIPGLGQLLSFRIRRGLLLFFSLVSIMGLFIWRLAVIAHREIGIADRLAKSFSREPFFIIFICLAIFALWLWIIYDAFKTAGGSADKSLGIFVLILVMFFSLGWQISEINVGKMIREFPEAWPPLSRILWPWEAAVTRDTSSVTAEAAILVDDTKNPPPIPEYIEGEPYIKSTPTYGKMSTLDADNNMILGDTIHLEGSGFEPDTETFIYWEDSVGNEFRPRQNGKYVTLTTDASGGFSFDLVIPYRLTPPSAVGQQIHHVQARQISEVGPVKASEPLRLTIVLMLETIFMGMMATFFGIIFAIPLSFLAARNLMSGSWITVTIYYIIRTIFNITRSIEPMIWALIAVVWVGLGPFAGIIALTIHTIAALGKLYSESIESIDPGPIEAIQATGANRLQTIMFAVVPQMIPPFVSFTIYRWDINVRMSTVIGMVGGGGIGFLLVQYIRLLDYKSAGIAVWFIAITVAILDYVSSKIRERFV